MERETVGSSVDTLSSLFAIVLAQVLVGVIVASVLFGPVLVGVLIDRLFVKRHKPRLGILMGFVPVLVLFLGIKWGMHTDIINCREQMARGIVVGLCGEFDLVFRCLVAILSRFQALVFLVTAVIVRPSSKQQRSTS
jgi:hypothetical protein